MWVSPMYMLLWYELNFYLYVCFQEEMTAALAFGVSNVVNFCLKINYLTVSLQLCVGLLLKVVSYSLILSPASWLFFLNLMWNQKLCNVGFYRAKRLERWHWYSTCFKTLLRKKVARDSYSIDTSSNRDVEDRRFLFSLVTVVGVVVESVAFKF